jgi:hypothetical protein
MGDDDMAADLGSLLEVNNLDYRLAPALSVGVSRRLRYYRAHNLEYKMGDQISVTLSTGAAYVDLQSSYLQFDICLPVQNGDFHPDRVQMPAGVGYDSIINRYNLIHSSGVELDRVAGGCGSYQKVVNTHNHSAEWRAVHGESMMLRDGRGVVDGTKAGQVLSNLQGVGFETYPNVKAPKNPAWALSDDTFFANSPGAYKGEGIRVRIPLACVAGFFNHDMLLPPFLAAGLRMELFTHTQEEFFKIVTDTALAGDLSGWGENKCVIKNVTVGLETFQLTDSISRKLAQISASSGLEWNWTAVHTATTSGSANTFSYQVARALSRANNIMTVVRNDAHVNGPDKQFMDSFSSGVQYSKAIVAGSQAVVPIAGVRSGNDCTPLHYQIQLGAQYIPAAPIDSTEEALASVLKTFGAYRRTDETVGQLQPLITGYAGLDLAKPGSAASNLLSVPLESSGTLAQSGAAISAQRTAVINIKLPASNEKRHFDFFVEYSKLATCFMDTVVVRV